MSIIKNLVAKTTVRPALIENSTHSVQSEPQFSSTVVLFPLSPCLLQDTGTSLFHLRHTLWLRLVFRIPAIAGHFRALFSSPSRSGERCGDGSKQPLHHSAASATQEGRRSSGPLQNIPDPQPLHASPVSAGVVLPATDSFSRGRDGLPGACRR